MNIGLIATLILGVSLLLGAVIVFLVKENEQFIEFSLSLALGVIIMLIIVDLIPEAFESFDMNFGKTILTIGLGTIAGFLILHILDKFIPDHEDDKKTTSDDDRNLKHIGLVASIALIIHNIVEGMSIYLLITNDWKAGLLACIGVGLHNIPLGMIITSAFYKNNKSIGKTLMILFGISLSTFLGGLIMFIFKDFSFLAKVEGIALIVTLGMLLYIVIMELIPKVIHCKNRKTSICGFVTGVLLLVGTLFL